MKFNIINYPPPKKLLLLELEVRSDGAALGNKKINNPISLPKIINELNNSSLLNISDQDEIPIIFENFTPLGVAKTFVKNWISRKKNEGDFESSVAHYDKEAKSVHIFNGIIEPKSDDENIKSSYEKLSNSVSNKDFLINFFTLHEIGHAIHDKVKNNKDFNNLTDHFREKGKNLLHYEKSLLFSENFADMFAAISLLKIDKNNSNLINDLQYFSDFRKNIQYEKYYTFNNLYKIIVDSKNNNLNFGKIDDVFDYINSNTNKELGLRLNQSLKNIDNSQRHNEQLGYLSKLFKIADNSGNGIISFLQNEIGYRMPSSVIFEHDSFEIGKTLFNKDSLSSKNIHQRIINCCSHFRENPNQNKDVFRPK